MIVSQLQAVNLREENREAKDWTNYLGLLGNRSEYRSWQDDITFHQGIWGNRYQTCTAIAKSWEKVPNPFETILIVSRYRMLCN